MAIRVENVLGKGLIGPLQRIAGKDFITAEGAQLVRAAIRQILMTEEGELRWRPTFGSGLTKYRHKTANVDLRSLIAQTVRRNLGEWDSRISVDQVITDHTESEVNIRVVWSVVDSSSGTNQVIAGPDAVDIRI